MGIELKNRLVLDQCIIRDGVALGVQASTAPGDAPKSNPMQTERWRFRVGAWGRVAIVVTTLEILLAATGSAGQLTISSSKTGHASMVRFEDDATRPRVNAAAFLSNYGHLFGVKSQHDLKQSRIRVDEQANEHRTYKQTHKGVTVFGGR